MKKHQVGIIGASGYVGAELISILINHPAVSIAAIASQHNKGVSFAELYPSFTGHFEQEFTDNDHVINVSDILFVCLPHGKSETLVKKALDQGKKVIDLGADFRLDNKNDFEKWYKVKSHFPEVHEQAVYGLSELNREEIKNTKLVANPGCYPTSILLGLYPVISSQLVDLESLVIDAKSGVTGAGKETSVATHYANKNEAFHAYKVASHQHTPEIEENLSKFSGQNVTVSFVPHLLPVNRGILSTMYINLFDNTDEETIRALYEKQYNKEPFVTVLSEGLWPNISHVSHSNQCHIGLTVDKRTNRLIVISAIDNMQKGAAGQAVQNFNIMNERDEKEGLSVLTPSF